MTHTNRGRLVVDVGGKWRLYTATIPSNSTAIGVVRRGELGDMGALVKMDNGTYVQVNAGSIRTLDQRKVKVALGISNNAGRPAEVTDGRRANVYLDSATIDKATALGDGSLSAGLRIAVAAYKSS